LKKQKGFPALLAFCILLVFQSLIGQSEIKKHVAPPDTSHSSIKFSESSNADIRANLKGEIGTFSPTFYRILDEDSPEWTAEPPTVELRGCDGEYIASVSQRYKHHLDIEGSGRLRGGLVVNIGGTHDGERCWLQPSEAPYGLGEDGNGLIPYRSLAVDPRVIKLGTVLYIPALDGIRLPNGELHDGLVIAHDTGSAIIGYRIDVFVGFENDVDNSLTNSGRIGNMESLSIYEVNDETASKVRQRFGLEVPNSQ
jgi:3D (Asp-Asp-Asp) domain-containing protein